MPHDVEYSPTAVPYIPALRLELSFGSVVSKTSDQLP